MPKVTFKLTVTVISRLQARRPGQQGLTYRSSKPHRYQGPARVRVDGRLARRAACSYPPFPQTMPCPVTASREHTLCEDCDAVKAFSCLPPRCRRALNSPCGGASRRRDSCTCVKVPALGGRPHRHVRRGKRPPTRFVESTPLCLTKSESKGGNRTHFQMRSLLVF